MKQTSMFPDDKAAFTKYTPATGSPLYAPSARRPHVAELVDNFRVHKLLKSIEASNVSDEEKRFLADAARRHAVFNYELIADYYANAGVEMQRLMEDSALVIVDFDRAIELGYVKLRTGIRRQYTAETPANGNGDGAYASTEEAAAEEIEVTVEVEDEDPAAYEYDDRVDDGFRLVP